tara:strand:- start:6622 stop:9141 length:2520 start_codon:yes stop_codon:yes gene_type:complete
MSPLKEKLKKALQLKQSHQIIIGVALGLCMTLMSAQRLLNTSLDTSLTRKSAELLTADIEIASTQALSTKNIDIISDTLPAHQSSRRQLFSSMIQFYGQQTKLVEIMAIEPNYPLRGQCSAMDTAGNIVPVSTLLSSTQNAIVIGKALPQITDITFGSTIKIGNFTGTVVGIIHQEPDISIQSLKLGPRIYMALDNVTATGFDQQLSRKYHSTFIAFDAPEESDPWVNPLSNALGIEGNRKTIQGSYGPSQPIVVRSFRDMNESVLRGFSSVNQFFLFLSLFILLLSGTAFGFIIWTTIIQKLPDIGNLRYLGIQIRQIHAFYNSEALRVASIATVLGLIMGAIIAQLCQWFIGTQLNLPFALITIHPMDLLFIAGFSIIGIYLMTRCVMKLTTSTRLFDQEQPQRASLQIIGLMALLLLGFMAAFLLINQVSFIQTLGLIGGFFTVFLALNGIDRLGSRCLKIIPTKNASLPQRLAIKYLSDGHTLRRMAFISICFSLIAMFSMAHYEKSLNHEFNPKNSDKVLPSLFVTDLYNHQLAEFKAMISQPHKLSPLSRTRILSINNQALAKYVEERDLSNTTFLYREQNLSSRDTLYETETLDEGEWFDPNNNTIEISVEERFAKRLKLRLNDQIQFSIFGLPFTGTITSFRSVDWSTFDPNFFMLIEPPHLKEFPQTWISAIYTKSDTETLDVQAALAQAFPNASVIDIQNTSEKVLGFFKTFIVAFKLGALFSFFIGGCLFLLLGKLYVDIRKESYNMLFWIGMSQRNIRKISLIENLWFTGMTAVSALIISLIIVSILFGTLIPIQLKINGLATGIIITSLIGIVFLEWKLKEGRNDL